MFGTLILWVASNLNTIIHNFYSTSCTNYEPNYKISIHTLQHREQGITNALVHMYQDFNTIMNNIPPTDKENTSLLQQLMSVKILLQEGEKNDAKLINILNSEAHNIVKLLICDYFKHTGGLNEKGQACIDCFY